MGLERERWVCFLDDTKKRSMQPLRGCETRKTGWREQEGTQLGGAAPTGLMHVQVSYAEDTVGDD